MTADSVKMTADSVKVDPVDHLRHSFNTCDTPSTPATQHLEFVKSVAMETMPLAKGTSCTRLLMIWPGVASCYICGCCLLHLWLLLATSVVASCYICSCFLLHLAHGKGFWLLQLLSPTPPPVRPPDSHHLCMSTGDGKRGGCSILKTRGKGG
jgi:hypothetical protein